jgi:FlaA1/EpsC-like NDP-sugar epimerase
MTKREAVELILLSVTIAQGGEVFLLDMGEPVRIYDLAKGLIKDTKSKSKIKIIGLRKGEKMFEELAYNESTMNKTEEEKLFMIHKELTDEQIDRRVRNIIRRTLTFDITDHQMYEFINKLGFFIKE